MKQLLLKPSALPFSISNILYCNVSQMSFFPIVENNIEQIKTIMIKNILLLFSLSLLFLHCSDGENPSEAKEIIEKIEKVMEPIQAVLEFKSNAKLGEGAFWNHRTRELYWVDIEGKQLNIYNPETKESKSFSTPSRIGTVVPCKNNEEAIIALEDGMYLINTLTGDLKLYASVEADISGNRFNDGKCDPAGRLWVGSMDLKTAEPTANLWRIDSNAKSTKMLDSITISNGIVWSADHKTMYYIDTPTNKIRAFDFNNMAGKITNERVVVEVDPKNGSLDGMAIDEEGMLWVGLWNGNGVARFNPTTGKRIAKIEVPAHNVTACAFGGPDLDKLYITTASIDMTDAEKEQFPDAGSVFVADPGVKGVKSSFFYQSK